MNYRPLIILLGLGLLAGLFFLLKPTAPVPDASVPTSTTASLASTAPAPMPSSPTAPETAARRFDLVVRNRRLVSGPATLQVTEGDEITIGITSDRAEELHLHGYDRKLELLSNVAGIMTFTADRSGRFEYELEHSRIVLGVLEVQPR